MLMMVERDVDFYAYSCLEKEFNIFPSKNKSNSLTLFSLHVIDIDNNKEELQVTI